MTVPPLSRVLVVDDDPDIQEIVRVSLEGVGGLAVRTCSSGAGAAQATVEFAPDLILLDVMMPGMDGPKTLRELRRAPGTAAVPVVFMTAKVQSQEVAAFQRMGAIDVLFKPFDPMRLAATLRLLWERHHRV